MIHEGKSTNSSTVRLVRNFLSVVFKAFAKKLLKQEMLLSAPARHRAVSVARLRVSDGRAWMTIRIQGRKTRSLEEQMAKLREKVFPTFMSCALALFVAC